MVIDLSFVEGKTYLQWYGSQAQLIVMDTELCKEILNDKDRVYRKPKKEGFALRLQGNGLPGIEGEKWSKVRKISMHAFHGESLKVSRFLLLLMVVLAN